MTRKLPSPCTFKDAQGPCLEYATNRGRCDKHQRKGWVQALTRHQRGYGAEHEADRQRQLRRSPRCQWPGCVQPATDLDHIIALADGGAAHDPRNHQSLCRHHHKIKTAMEAKRRKANHGSR